MFTTENTTHAEAVRLLNDRDAKTIDLYNTISAYQRKNSLASALLYNVLESASNGEIAQNLSINPFSVPAIKEINRFFSPLKS